VNSVNNFRFLSLSVLCFFFFFLLSILNGMFGFCEAKDVVGCYR